ncbi:D-hexose-6-phosphate mutarotase [bacterium]|nr:D-hexose-6-phosphate mutarotase [bacterium]MBP9811061.1 D-hexose-6-phosphate mutarotase [bacterium]
MNPNQMANCKDFVIPGILAIEDKHELTRATITTSLCTAEIYLQGAHLTQWQPQKHEPVLFLSESSPFVRGKAIRGGVPIIFPWFGPRTATVCDNRSDGPAHGFARTEDWQVVSAAMEGEQLVLILCLEANEVSRALGFDQFRLQYSLTFGTDLIMQLTVENHSPSKLCFAEALHTYFLVGDCEQIGISGLADNEYYDKTDGFKRKRQGVDELILRLKGEIDRPYINSSDTLVLRDPVTNRRITVSKSHSNTTVIWNPGAELTAKMTDMSPEGWKQMVCIEAANALENAITLGPGEKHTMTAHIEVEHSADSVEQASSKKV